MNRWVHGTLALIYVLIVGRSYQQVVLAIDPIVEQKRIQYLYLCLGMALSLENRPSLTEGSTRKNLFPNENDNAST
jgi:hypothetical protein